MVDLIEALSHVSQPVRRLLDMAVTWPDSPVVPTPRAGVTLRTARQLREAELDELVEAYRAGETVYTLAAQFRISRGTVGKHLRARGVDTTPPGLRPDDVPEAARLYRDGWSLRRIGTKFDASDDTVRRRLLAVGVVMRDRQGGRRK